MSSTLARDCLQPGHPGDISKKEAEAGILPSHGKDISIVFSSSLLSVCGWTSDFNSSSEGISLDVPGYLDNGRPPIIQHL